MAHMLSPAPGGVAWSPAFSTRPEIVGTFGVVASTHWLASSVGQAVLERGGNAFDAACAAGFTLQVVEPHLNGPGGDCPIILHSVATRAQEVICGQGPSPAAATAEAFAALGLDLVPGTGLLCAVVPGAFDAWLTMLERHGTWRLADVLEYAIGYAQRGFPMLPRISATITSVKPLFEAEWHSSAAVWLPGGNVPEPGSLFCSTAVAATYARIVQDSAGGTREQEIARARGLWYQGFVAGAVGEFFANTEILDTSGRRHRGLLAADDFAAWRATVEEPLRYDYGRHTVLKCGPWSQGPAFLQTLALLRGFDLAALETTSAEFVHLVVEAQKLAFADREAFYGDEHSVPMETLLSDAYNDARRRLITDAASLELRPGSVPGHEGWVDHDAHRRTAASYNSNFGAGEPTVARLGAIGGDTCHLDVIDAAGNMVSATPSAGWLQSSPVIPELGFPMGSRGQMFWLRPGTPNSLAPRKRPRTTLSPSFALRDGEPWMAFGTPGGEQQDQWSLAFFLRMAHHGLDIQQAIDAPGFHAEHWPSSFWPRGARPGRLVIEERFGAAVAEDLSARGHAVEVGPPWSEGRLAAARREDGMMKAGANPRGQQGYAVGR
jgi:gamma-glutamyltranspeptidase/glutathione hydrolase